VISVACPSTTDLGDPSNEGAPARAAQEVAATGAALVELRRRLAAESDAAVRQDLEILVQAAEDTIAKQAALRRVTGG
jgi:predicted nucleic acid-binding Zn ribbon protein